MDKDPIYGFRSVTVKKDSSGRDMTVLYINQEDVLTIAKDLASNKDNPKGAKLQIHVGDKQNSQTGHSFKSAFMFVKGVAEAPQGGFGGGGGKPQGKFVPKTQGMSPATQAKAAETLGTTAESDDLGPLAD